MADKPILENIFKDFKSFKSSPITYVFFVITVFLFHNIWSNNKDKTQALENCQEEQRVLNKKFQDIFFKKEKVEENDSTINSLNK